MSYSGVIHCATSLLCANSGAMGLQELHRSVLQRCHIGKDEFWFVVSKCSRFLVVQGNGTGVSDCTVVARTSLRLCRKYGAEDCAACQQLHLCKHFVYGNCRFGKARKLCKFSHDIRSDHNYPLLSECTLHELKQDELFLLLLQNDPSLLPEVCLHYNKGSGLHGACTFQENCTKMHLCMHFIQGACVFGRKCKRQHAVDQHSRNMLEEKGLSGAMIQNLPHIYQNIHRLTTTSPHSHTEDPPDSACQPAAHSGDTNEICLHHLRNNCRFQNQCALVHFPLPYKWEVFDGDEWKDLEHMEEIERDYCDPHRTQSSGSVPVDFQSMTLASHPVCRLSTVSSVTKPPHYVLTTEWLWYYKGDQRNWVEYGQPDDKQRTTSVTSRSLEEVYNTDAAAEVPVVKGQRQYYISFKDMYQRNPKHNTKRHVRRRPRFVSVADVKQKL
ncbi:protein mono-ADP-ribosyltransferase PARP12b isoform X2 [Genypterus blacodes]|uniref:protein mono-ADP-ribosyltransferase PARP12b isoform X2 n=1 Tax=Genypterus blacodes TaxID=154954 RepID=UPI003F76FC27